jgi:hypothetical protein
VADGTANASCADTDGDGVGGLIRLSIRLRDARTGEAYTGIIAPLDGDADESGRMMARLLFERGEPTAQVFEGWLRVNFFEHRH